MGYLLEKWEGGTFNMKEMHYTQQWYWNDTLLKLGLYFQIRKMSWKHVGKCEIFLGSLIAYLHKPQNNQTKLGLAFKVYTKENIYFTFVLF